MLGLEPRWAASFVRQNGGIAGRDLFVLTVALHQKNMHSSRSDPMQFHEQELVSISRVF